MTIETTEETAIVIVGLVSNQEFESNKKGVVLIETAPFLFYSRLMLKKL
jgi:hypothetical protein